jgi:hypothetical protein
MPSRYDGTIILENNQDLYKEVLKSKGLRSIKHFGTPVIKYPSSEQIDRLKLLGHIWSVGDRYYKLAFEHYGDSELWWIIAWFNKSPTESHLKLGDTILIPFPLEYILQYYGL